MVPVIYVLALILLVSCIYAVVGFQVIRVPGEIRKRPDPDPTPLILILTPISDQTASREQSGCGDLVRCQGVGGPGLRPETTLPTLLPGCSAGLGCDLDWVTRTEVTRSV